MRLLCAESREAKAAKKAAFEAATSAAVAAQAELTEFHQARDAVLGTDR